jgi:hypothetical protein
MKRRGGLFFIGLISAIATIISLNIAFGRSGYYYERYPYYNRYHHCDERYDRNRDERSKQDHDRRSDSTNGNY